MHAQECTHKQKVQACSKRCSFSHSVSMRDYYINGKVPFSKNNQNIKNTKKCIRIYELFQIHLHWLCVIVKTQAISTIDVVFLVPWMR